MVVKDGSNVDAVIYSKSGKAQSVQIYKDIDQLHKDGNFYN